MQHPSDERWFDEESATHRAGCATCRAEHERLERGLACLRELSRSAGNLPESFWERQRVAIQDRLKTSRPASRYRSAWVWATAATVVVLILLIISPSPTQSVVPDIAAGDDQELLVGIEHSLARDLPEALQPVSILVQEIDKTVSRSASRMR